VRIVGKYGDCQWIRESEDGFGSGIILAEVVENDGEAWSVVRTRSEFDRGNRGFSDVNCVSWKFAVEILKGETFAALDDTAVREFVLCGDIIESLDNQVSVGV
jgi:hypothetical protein